MRTVCFSSLAQVVCGHDSGDDAKRRSLLADPKNRTQTTTGFLSLLDSDLGLWQRTVDSLFRLYAKFHGTSLQQNQNRSSCKVPCPSTSAPAATKALSIWSSKTDECILRKRSQASVTLDLAILRASWRRRRASWEQVVSKNCSTSSPLPADLVLGHRRTSTSTSPTLLCKKRAPAQHASKTSNVFERSRDEKGGARRARPLGCVRWPRFRC